MTHRTLLVRYYPRPNILVVPTRGKLVLYTRVLSSVIAAGAGGDVAGFEIFKTVLRNEVILHRHHRSTYTRLYTTTGEFLWRVSQGVVKV